MIYGFIFHSGMAASDGKIVEAAQVRISDLRAIIEGYYDKQEPAPTENVPVRPRQEIQSLLEKLCLTAYYPQKLTMKHVLTLTKESLKNPKPTSLEETSW